MHSSSDTDSAPAPLLPSLFPNKRLRSSILLGAMLSPHPLGKRPSPKTVLSAQHNTAVQAAELSCMQLPSALQVLHQYHRSTEGGEGLNPTAPSAAPDNHNFRDRAGDAHFPTEAGAGNQEAKMIMFFMASCIRQDLSLCDVLLLCLHLAHSLPVASRWSL